MEAVCQWISNWVFKVEHPSQLATFPVALPRAEQQSLREAPSKGEGTQPRVRAWVMLHLVEGHPGFW